MEDFKSLFVFVACERCRGVDLSAIHGVFPVIAWETFSVHIFFCCSLNVVVNDSVSAKYFPQVPCPFERYYCVILKCFS